MVAVKKSYRKLNKDNLVIFSTNFKKNLFLDPTTYPTPPHSEATMTTRIQEYETAYGNWRAERSAHNAGITRTKRALLIKTLDEQVEYVELNASDAAAVVSLALEPAATESGTTPIPGQPTGEGIKASGEAQSVTVYCKPVKLVNSTARVTYYVYETNVDGTVQLGLMASGTNSKKLSFGGLTTGKVYYFYIRARTTAGFGIPSKVIRWVGQ